MIVESKTTIPGHDQILAGIDPAHTLLIVGSRTVLKRAANSPAGRKPAKAEASLPNGKEPALCLDTYPGTQGGRFRQLHAERLRENLHPMLIAAVERPLILLTLRETKGNQIQAAELLGLNRNTLRKKILDLDIPVKRARAN